MALANKRSVMTLYSNGASSYSHRVRLVLAEKGVVVDIVDVNGHNPPEDLRDLNPYDTLPTLVDRDLVLYDSRIMMEYLDERFPHPPLLPVYPVARAKSRQMIYRIERDWYRLMNRIENPAATDDVNQLRVQLRDSLVAITPVFAELPYFLSDEFTLVDCTLAPLLWRLQRLGIKLPAKASAIEEYAQRVFERESFKASLSEDEREMQLEEALA